MRGVCEVCVEWVWGGSEVSVRGGCEMGVRGGLRGG